MAVVWRGDKRTNIKSTAGVLKLAFRQHDTSAWHENDCVRECRRDQVSEWVQATTFMCLCGVLERQIHSGAHIVILGLVADDHRVYCK